MRQFVPKYTFSVLFRHKTGLRAPSCPVPARTARVPWCGPVAVGRDVPIAPPRHCPRWLTAAVRGLASRIFRTQNSRRHYPRALPGRRDRDIAPYRHYTRALRMRITHMHRPRWLTVFVILYIPLKSSLYPFVLINTPPLPADHTQSSWRGKAALLPAWAPRPAVGTR